MAQYLTNPVKTAPAAANGVAVPPSGTAYNNSAWVELLAAAGAASALTSVICVTPAVTATFEVDIGVGAAGSEIVIATLKGQYKDNNSCSDGRMSLPIPIAAIPNGARVAVRMRKSGTSTTNWAWAIEYIELPVVGNLLTTDRPTLITAPAADLTNIAVSTTAWAYGAWTTIVTAVGAETTIVGLVIPAPFASADYEIQLGKGSAGAEVVIGNFKGYATNNADGPSYVPLWNPIGGITTGQRLAARVRKAGTSASTVPFGLVYLEGAVAGDPMTTAVTYDAPTGASSLDLSSGSGAWSYGAWVEFISATTAISQIVGVALGNTSYASKWIEIEFGIGAAGSEKAIGSLFFFGGASSGKANNIIPLRRPIDLVPAGVRVALRARSATGFSAGDIPVTLQYQQISDSEDVAVGELKYEPNAAVGVTVTPNGTAWLNSNWAQITAGLTEDIDLVGIACSMPTGTLEFEIDIGTGAAASETVITTIRSAYRTANQGNVALYLPAPYPIAANTRLAVRIRKSDAGNTNRLVSLLYYGGAVDVTPPGGGGDPGDGTDPATGSSICGGAVPLAWLELTPAGGSTTYRYAKVPINIDSDPKEPRVETFDKITRQLSTDLGDFRASSGSPVLIDTDRVLRTLENSDSLVGARVVEYVSTEALIRAAADPRRVFEGIVVDTEPLSGLKFRLQLADYFGALLEEFAANRTFPQKVFNVDDFPNLANSPDDPTSPGNPALIGKPVPIAYGLQWMPAHFVGLRTVNSFNWYEFAVLGHATTGGILQIKGDIGGTQQTFLESQEGGEVLLPGHAAGWTAYTGSSNVYRDYNGNRYTTFFALGPRAESARLGKVPFLVYAGGVEDVGDGSGTMIDGLYHQILHLLVNFVFGNYTSGAWLSPPVVPGELFSRINTQSFKDLQTFSESLLTGGFLGAFMLGWDGRTHTLTDILREAAINGGYRYGVNRDGQLFATIPDPTASTNRTLADLSHVIRETFRVRRRRQEIGNTITYRYARNYSPTITNETPAAGERLPANNVQSSAEWGTEATPLTDATSVTKYGTKTRDLSLSMIADADTADARAALELALYKQPPITTAFEEGPCGTDTDLADLDSIDHFENLDTTARKIHCEKHVLDLDTFKVEKEYIDITDITL